MPDDTDTPDPGQAVEHLYGAAAEEELIRLERACRRLGKMRRVTVQAPPREPELTAGDMP